MHVMIQNNMKRLANQSYMLLLLFVLYNWPIREIYMLSVTEQGTSHV